MATDLVDTYKFLNGHYKTKPDTFFSTPSKDIRGHSHKLFRRRYRTQLAGQFYSNRVVQPWNSLPEYVVSAPTVASFSGGTRGGHGGANAPPVRGFAPPLAPPVRMGFFFFLFFLFNFLLFFFFFLLICRKSHQSPI